MHKETKITILLILSALILSLFYIDYIDINERFRFPINIIDEPILLLIGVILGYSLARFRFFKIITNTK